MPLNKALDLLRSDYYDYISYLKFSCNEQIRQQDQEDNEAEKAINSRSILNVLFEKFTKKENVSLTDIDFLLTILNRQKEKFTLSIDKNHQNSGASMPNQIPALNQPLISTPLVLPLQMFNPTNLAVQLPSFFQPQFNSSIPIPGNINLTSQIQSILGAPPLTSTNTYHNNNNKNNNGAVNFNRNSNIGRRNNNFNRY